MAKSYKFKKSYIKQSINLYAIRLIMFLLSWSFPKKEKVLIKSADGIGDLLIRSKLAEMIQEKYGKENCIFLVKDSFVQMGKILNYNCIGFSKREEEDFFPRLKKMYQLNKLGIKVYINLEFGGDITVGNIFAEKKIGMIDPNPFVSRCNKYYDFNFLKLENIYILDLVTYMGKKIIDSNLKKEDFFPDLRNIYPSSDHGISVAVGTSSRDKVTSPYIMAEYLKLVIKKYPKEKIYLLGNGKLQENYAEKLIEILKNEKIINLVNTTNIEEAFEKIANSKIFIGFDSGMYNFAFTVRKKTIAFFENNKKSFFHNEPWINVLYPDKESKTLDTKGDKVYTNILMNSIDIKKIEKVLEKLGD